MSATAAPPRTVPTGAPPTAHLLETWRANLAALYDAAPELARELDRLPFGRLPPLEPTRDGGWTVRRTADDGMSVYIHSRYAPRAEARALIRAQLDPMLQSAEQGADEPVLLLSGLGLGYAIAEIHALWREPLILAAETDLPLLKAALCVTDMSEPLRAGRLQLLTAVDKAAVHERLRPWTTPLMLGLRCIPLPHTARCHAAAHNELRALVRDFITFSRLQMLSLLRNARVTCRNIALNLPHYVSNPGVEALAGVAAGWPAIVVAAGPSLARNIDQLPALRDRAVIIAVQTVFKTLQQRGLTPHFTTSLDYHEISAEFFRGVEDFGDCRLVAEPKAHHQVLDAYRGRKHLVSAGFAQELLRGSGCQRGGLKAGSTVAHLAFYLAQHLGCDPIILVGQDLCFTEGLYYPAGMPIEAIWAPELGRFNTLEMKQWERIARFRKILRTVPDIHGRPTYTDEQLFTYAEQFQADFLAARCRIIHASEGGMRLAGAEVMTLRDAAERFCTRPLPAGLFECEIQENGAALRRAATQAVQARIAEIRELRDLSQEMTGLLTRLHDLVERPAEFNRVVAQVDVLRHRIQRHEDAYRLVSYVSQLAELRRIRADRRMGDASHDTPATARRRLRRDREFVEAFIDGCDYLLGLLPETLQRLQECEPESGKTA